MQDDTTNCIEMRPVPESFVWMQTEVLNSTDTCGRLESYKTRNELHHARTNGRDGARYQEPEHTQHFYLLKITAMAFFMPVEGDGRSLGVHDRWPM